MEHAHYNVDYEHGEEQFDRDPVEDATAEGTLHAHPLKLGTRSLALERSSTQCNEVDAYSVFLKKKL